MKKLLAPFDREIKGVFKVINMQSSLYIVLSKKSSIEEKKKFKLAIDSALRTQRNADCGD